MRNSMKWIIAIVLLVSASAAHAEVKTKEITYRQGDTELKGFLAWDDAAKGKRPGVLVVHEWWGLNENIRNQAVRVAKAGYVGLALDMYGDGKVATHPEDAQAFTAEATKDPAVTAARFHDAMEQLKQDPHVDTSKIGAIGYCFGGGIVLDRARAGDPDLDVVASFHGMLATKTPAEKGKVKARILAATGEADPFVPASQVSGFKQEMAAAGANFKVVSYPGAKHGFTNPDAGKYGMEQLAYNADADKKSWAEMLKMFKEVWK